jgi:hypothetical protein
MQEECFQRASAAMFEELRSQEEPAKVAVTQQCAHQEQEIN